jgi:hypothetical protein
MDEEVEAVKNELRQLLAAFTARNAPLTPELRIALSEAIDRATHKINQLRSNQPIPTDAEKLWVLSGANRQAFENYVKTFPSPAIQQLNQQPVRLSNLMDRLSSQITLPAGEQLGGIPKAPINSSTVYGFQYDPSNKKLLVRFQGGGVYRYDGVPPSIFKLFQAGAIPCRTTGENKFGKWWRGKVNSYGASFYNIIRNIYPYQRIA